MSKSLQEKDRELIWHPFAPLKGGWENLLVKSAEGPYLILEDGRRVFDAISSWWVNLHGHSNPHITKAITKQAETLEHVIFAGFTHEPAIQLSENLLSILPSNQQKIFFSDDGSTSVEVALKMALQYWHNKSITKRKIVAINGAYHGDTFGAMSVGERGPFNEPFHNHLFEVDFIDFPSPKNEKSVTNNLTKVISTGEFAAFIYEPLVQGAAGMRMYSPEILENLIDTCKKHQVLCIADEVMTGFGRTGKLFASQYINTNPDIICLSKGITGGTMPLGVTSCSDEILDAFDSDEMSKTFFHGHSFTGNPLACAVANASFELLMKQECQEAIKMISELQSNFVEEIKGHKKVVDARATGTIMALELETASDSGYMNKLRSLIYPYFLENDVLIRPLGNIIYVIPPYVSTKRDIERVYNLIHSFMDTKMV